MRQTFKSTFNSKKMYFDDIGTPIRGTRKTEDAIKLAGLDYNVVAQTLYLEDGTVVPNKFANVRTDNNQILGVVGKNYNIISNQEGFDFIDSLIDGGAEFEAAGHFNNGRGAFMIAKTEPMRILGDDFASHILFTNTFDGSGTVKAMFTPSRVACANGIVIVSDEVQSQISIRHASNYKDKITIARDTLLKNSKYLEFLKKKSEQLAATKMSKDEFVWLADKLFPVSDDASLGIVERNNERKNELITLYNAEDLQNYNNTAYKAVMAVADYETHAEPLRNTNNQFVKMKRIMSGMLLLNTAIALIQKRFGIR